MFRIDHGPKFGADGDHFMAAASSSRKRVAIARFRRAYHSTAARASASASGWNAKGLWPTRQDGAKFGIHFGPRDIADCTAF